jgi:hypothetical protein
MKRSKSNVSMEADYEDADYRSQSDEEDHYKRLDDNSSDMED